MQNKLEALIDELEETRDKIKNEVSLAKYPASRAILLLRLDKLEHRIEQAKILMDQIENIGEQENDEPDTI